MPGKAVDAQYTYFECWMTVGHFNKMNLMKSVLMRQNIYTLWSVDDLFEKKYSINKLQLPSEMIPFRLFQWWMKMKN